MDIEWERRVSYTQSGARIERIREYVKFDEEEEEEFLTAY